MDNAAIGRKGEKIAESFLVDKKYEIIEKNFHYGRNGEIDIIAKENGEFVFIEVKYSGDIGYGYPENRITSGKKSKIRKVAQAWMFQNNISDQPCRIDVIAIVGNGKKPEITHYINAF